MLHRARRHAAIAEDDEAKAVYLALLHRDPTHFEALIDLAGLAYLSGHRSAARTAYEQAVHCHPRNPTGHVNLGNMFYEDGDLARARRHFGAALAVDQAFPEAHRGMGKVLADLGDDAGADSHWRQSFIGQAVTVKPYRGSGRAVAVLLLVSAKGGNIPTRNILDDRVFAVTALYAEYYDPALPLPSHDLVFNAIGDADLCPVALARAVEIVARSTAPVINHPARVRETGRAGNAERLAAVSGARLPRMQVISRKEPTEPALPFPLLLRAPGFHTGQHFVQVARAADLPQAAAAMPGDTLLAIEYLDARGADGMARKYRAMIIDSVLYPLHLAVSADWKVHYFTAAMAGDAAYRDEERRYLEDMPSVIGAQAMAALGGIGEILGLDYAGVDFAIGPDGALLVFEANATMVINPPDPDPIWNYRRAPIGRALDAAKEMLRKRARGIATYSAI